MSAPLSRSGRVNDRARWSRASYGATQRFAGSATRCGPILRRSDKCSGIQRSRIGSNPPVEPFAGTKSVRLGKPSRSFRTLKADPCLSPMRPHLRHGLHQSTMPSRKATCALTKTATASSQFERRSHLAPRSWGSPQQTFRAEILVDIRPMNPVSAATKLPSVTLLLSGVQESRKPRQRHGDGPSAHKVGAQPISVASDRLNSIVSPARQSIHLMFPEVVCCGLEYDTEAPGLEDRPACDRSDDLRARVTRPSKSKPHSRVAREIV